MHPAPCPSGRGLVTKGSMQPEPPAPKPSRKRHLVRWISVVILAILGWYGWKAYDFEQAVKEAKARRWVFEYDGPIAIIRDDWRKAFRKDTWNASGPTLRIFNDDQWEPHFDLIHRLDPKHVDIGTTCRLGDLSKFTALSNLARLNLFYCPKLTNLDALKDMKGLTMLVIVRAPGLTNIDALKELKTLKELELSRCAALTNVDALGGLKALKTLDFTDCTGLKNLDGILGLTGLEKLDLSGCDGLTHQAIAAIAVALPNTYIRGPDLDILPLSGKTLTPDKK